MPNDDSNQDDSKDETESTSSQSKQFIKNKSKNQNGSGESLISNASQSNSTSHPRNPFGTDDINKIGAKKKRKTSPPVSLAPPFLSSSHIANRSDRKSVNFIIDSDEDDDFIEMPSTVEVTRQKIKPSPIVKNKPHQQQQRFMNPLFENKF